MPWQAEPVVEPCALCGRGFDPDRLTKHHCLPKSKGGTSDDVEMICSQCHGMIHATYTNATLAAVYPTISELRIALELAGFLKWVRKQPATRKKKNKPRKRRV
jgi:5-methylcytosine-specific restriction protein A